MCHVSATQHGPRCVCVIIPALFSHLELSIVFGRLFSAFLSLAFFALLLLDTCDRLLVHLHLRQPVRQALPLAVLLPLPSALCLPPTVPVSCTNTQLSKPIELHK